MIGGSNNVHKPGGAIVRNIISGDYQGELRIVNPKEDDVQGIKACHDVKDLPQTDLAVLVVAAKFCRCSWSLRSSVPTTWTISAVRRASGPS